MTSGTVSRTARKSSTLPKNIFLGGGMISGAQIRAARALLRWSAEKLAGKCGLSPGSIRSAERFDEMPEKMQAGNLLAIKTALEKAGVEFDGGNGGVRLRQGTRK
jgi:transcriptional regulator with XRE-family HTH domain